MDWIYVYYHKPTGYLIDEDGDPAIFGADDKTPVKFSSFQEADDYLREHDIRASIAA